jgi:hypothetical protein
VPSAFPDIQHVIRLATFEPPRFATGPKSEMGYHGRQPCSDAALTAPPATTLTAGHSRKSFGSAGPPSGSSCTHSPLPANSPCIACTAQARVPVSPSVSAPHRARQSDGYRNRDTALERTGNLRSTRHPRSAKVALVPCSQASGNSTPHTPACRPPCGPPWLARLTCGSWCRRCGKAAKVWEVAARSYSAS